MSMGYISIETTKKFSIEIKGEFWVFVVLAAVLLLCTLSPYFWHLRRQRAAETLHENSSL